MGKEETEERGEGDEDDKVGEVQHEEKRSRGRTSEEEGEGGDQGKGER